MDRNRRTRSPSRPPLERLAFVNREINRFLAYRSDASLYGVEDHWASLGEMIEHAAGDCEDFALLKKWTLVRVGIPESAMAIMVVRIAKTQEAHAVLAVYTRDDVFLLDNRHHSVLSSVDDVGYVPLYSMSSAGHFVHGRRISGWRDANL